MKRLPKALPKPTTHIIDWIHLAMKIRPMQQIADHIVGSRPILCGILAVIDEELNNYRLTPVGSCSSRQGVQASANRLWGLGRRRDTVTGALHGPIDPAAEGLGVNRTPVLIALAVSALSGAVSGALIAAAVAWWICAHG